MDPLLLDLADLRRPSRVFFMAMSVVCIVEDDEAREI
jgi:hypothetical protein